MKNKISKVIVVLIAIIAITGCTMKENLHMKISSNKDVKITLIAAMDNEMIDTMISMQESGQIPSNDTEKKTYTDEERWKFLETDENDTISVPSDYTVKKYDQDGFKGYIAEKDLGSIDTMSIEKGTETERINIFSDDDKLFEGKLFIKDKTEYTSNMRIDLSASEDSTEMSSYESYGAAFDMKLVIEFPKVPISHNADEVSADGKTLSWDLLKSKDVEFTFDFKKNGNVVKTPPTDIEQESVEEKTGINILLVAGILGGILVLGIIIVVVIIIVVTRKKPQPIQIQQTIEQPQEMVNSNQNKEPVTVKVEEHKEESNITTNNTIETNKEVTEIQQSEVMPPQEEENVKQSQENNEETKAE